MPIAINGSGTITGISAGGLPDASVTADEIASGAVTPAKLSSGAPSWDSSGNLSFNSGYGSAARAYGCRAWVNFNGTGTVAIVGSGNVTSITDQGVGNYLVNLTTALPDTNGAVFAGSWAYTTWQGMTNGVKLNSTSVIELSHQENNIPTDGTSICVSAFR
jgi:hypothetical protein